MCIYITVHKLCVIPQTQGMLTQNMYVGHTVHVCIRYILIKHKPYLYNTLTYVRTMRSSIMWSPTFFSHPLHHASLSSLPSFYSSLSPRPLCATHLCLPSVFEEGMESVGARHRWERSIGAVWASMPHLRVRIRWDRVVERGVEGGVGRGVITVEKTGKAFSITY